MDGEEDDKQGDLYLQFHYTTTHAQIAWGEWMELATNTKTSLTQSPLTDKLPDVAIGILFLSTPWFLDSHITYYWKNLSPCPHSYR
jgi:hypothetical protein